MQAVWKLVQTCVVPIITYASETWHLLKNETKRLNQALDKILRRILMTPDSTPREALYIETGLLDIETIADSKRLNMKARLNRDKSDMMAKILSYPECQWEKDTARAMEKNHITPSDLTGSKNQVKETVRKAVEAKFKRVAESASPGKSKLTYFLEGKCDWQSGKRANYMNELTRKQTSLIFKARTRMIKVKGNYKNGQNDLTCRICKNNEETQTHILEECLALHQNDTTKIPRHQLFSTDIGTLRTVAYKIENILEKLGDAV